MAIFVQVDSGVVTGVLQTDGGLDASKFPAGRRFLALPEGTPEPAVLSTVSILNDPGDPIVPFDPLTMTVTPPPPVVLPPDPVQEKLDAILAEVLKP